MKDKKYSINRIANDALLLALLVVCAWVSIPLGSSPITLQTFGVLLVILIAPGIDAILIVLTYVLMGTFGLPVFNGGTSGFSSLTYGFIIGFLVGAVFIYLYKIIFERNRGEKLLDIIIKCIIFELVIYIAGISYFAILSTSKNFIGWLVYFLPYMGIDTIKCVFVVIIYTKLVPILKKMSENNKIKEEDDHKE